jgi:peroxiredoxin Q/BCP
VAGIVWIVVAGLAVATAFVVVPKGSSGGGTPASAPRSGPAPAFSERDVVSGVPLSNGSLRGRNVLLFFSEGVMCQACFQQIQALQANVGGLKSRRLLLVNVTTDSPDVLRQAAQAYGITTPLVSDEDRDMSNAYDVLGQGMHPDTAGHTFVLLDRRGQIRWRRDYGVMYVPPGKLFADIPDV